MARPANKADLLKQSEENLSKLLAFIDGLPEIARTKEYKFKDNERDKNISDVICHLHEWHNMMVRWYTDGMADKTPAIPGEGYTWQTLPALNRVIWQRYHGTPLDEAIGMLRKSHGTIMELIDKHSDEELFTKKYYKWTGSTSLGSYFVSSASSHYDWGLKTLKTIKNQI